MKALLSNIEKEWKLIYRGLKMIHKLQPYTILVSVASGLFSCILPYINIYFSSVIITELSIPSRDIKRITYLVILTLVLNLVCRLISNFLGQMLDIMQYALGHKKELDLASKGYQLDYCDVGDVKVREHREKLNHGRYHRGIIAIVFQLKTLTQYIFSVFISISLIIEMFIAKAIDSGQVYTYINSPITITVLCIIIIYTIYYEVKTNAISQIKQYEMMGKAAPHFNYTNYYTYQLSTEYNAGKDIRLYNQKKLIEKQILFHIGKTLNFQKIVPNLNAKFWSISSALRVVVNIMTYLYVGLKALAGAFGVGSIVLYTGAINQFGDGFSVIMQTLTNIKQNSEYLGWYFDFLDLPNRKETGERSIDMDLVKDAIIEFRNVSFKYPCSDEYSLKNISIRFNVSERVAVVGKNGSGKTTFIKLLCRLYDPTEGEILLNGVNIKEYCYNDYLAAFSVVFQDFNLFSFTLGENIAVSSDYDAKQVTDCIYTAGLEERMKSFPKGLQTQLYNEFSDDGVEISGGEAQKIAIARALYKDAPFIVLDEPTAALDPIAEADIYSRLDELIKDKTAIYISHRLSSCCFCNQIAVFDQGELIQHGSHKDLLEQENGLYNELWNAQARYYA